MINLLKLQFTPREMFVMKLTFEIKKKHNLKLVKQFKT